MYAMAANQTPLSYKQLFMYCLCRCKMAAIGEVLFSIQICDITSCSICLETFKKPKVLPCIHTFCLQCLNTYCLDKDPGEETTCPLCRKVFSIPLGGVQSLPNNFFIHQFLQVNKSTDIPGTQDSDKSTVCEICSDSEVKVTATSYCMECEEHMCDRCSVAHKNSKAT